ncbi:hypothetical protein IF1G_02322 [Cordyceps javanica]|uniref:Uncharacterized protein n=1 Tax=Cordyceps javanica TaxID=43265 RepID=A0A545V945_9HYPO|nr:hypothetical protein IF1G_02322 [Cordyceps javanica]
MLGQKQPADPGAPTHAKKPGPTNPGVLEPWAPPSLQLACVVPGLPLVIVRASLPALVGKSVLGHRYL